MINKTIKALLAPLLLAGSLASAQMAIGKQAVTNSSVSLEFGTGTQGLIIPYIPDVSKLPALVPGTIYLNAATGVMQYVKDASGTLQPLSFTGSSYIGGVLQNNISNPVDTSLQANLTDLPNARVVVGPVTDTAPGILVLSDTAKAMVLPKMDSPHLNIINPAPGMMAYDTKMHQVAVFNGTVWTFWKP